MSANSESKKVLQWVAISALVAGISGVIVGFVVARLREPRVVPVVASVASVSTPLRGASSNRLLLVTLENSESGKPSVEGDRSVQIILTFQTDDGRYCRAFSARDASAAAQGVACRNGEQWEVVAWDGTADSTEGIPAGGSSELIDDAMDRLGGIAQLEVAEERELIEQRWRAAPHR